MYNIKLYIYIYQLHMIFNIYIYIVNVYNVKVCLVWNNSSCNERTIHV